MNVNPFQPNFANTKSLAATSSSSSVQLAPSDFSMPGQAGGHTAIRVVNVGPNTAFIRWGTATAVGTAVLTDMPVLAGTAELFTFPLDASTIAAICAVTQTAQLYFTCGEGV